MPACTRDEAADAGAMTGEPTLPDDIFAQRMAASQDALSPAARRVIRFIDRNRATALASSAAELAASIGTSDATVIRAVQALGFEGLGDMRQALVASLTRPASPAEAMRRTLAEMGAEVRADAGDDPGAGAARAVDLVLTIHQEALAALQEAETRARIAAAVAVLHRARRVAVFGIGPSAPLAHYAALLLGRIGRAARTLDATGIELADQLLDLRGGDVLLVFAYTNPYREVAAAFGEARRQGLPVVLITDSADSRLARYADVLVPAPRGRAERVALHGATMVVLEAIVMGLAASDRVGAVAALERLNELREAVAGRRLDVG
jgi:DNA-binding MurR/RpiR family transcriptional regulator